MEENLEPFPVQSWGTICGLTPETIQVLIGNGFTSIGKLLTLNDANIQTEIDNLLSPEQRPLLAGAIRRLEPFPIEAWGAIWGLSPETILILAEKGFTSITKLLTLNQSEVRATIEDLLSPEQRPLFHDAIRGLNPNQPDPSENSDPEQAKGWKQWAWDKKFVLGGVAAGAVAAPVAVPVALGAAGFTSAGIAAGSWAASWMSAAAAANGGGVVAGSAVAVAQSIGAAGLGAVGTTVSGAIGAGVGSLPGLLAKKFSREKPKDDEKKE